LTKSFDGPVDPAVIKSFRELEELGNPGFLRRIVELYLVDTGAKIQQLCRAVAEGDASEAQMVSHTLKGSSSHLGARHLTTLFGRIEDIAAAGDLSSCGGFLVLIQAQFQAVKASLEGELRGG
jgi:HPt (histidine-containing phosphotransfer) domain-containing protein